MVNRERGRRLETYLQNQKYKVETLKLLRHLPWTSLCPRRLLHNRDAAILPRCALCQLHTRAFVAWWLSQSTSPYHVLCAQTICNTHDHSPCSCLPYGRGGARWDLNSKLRRTSLRRRKKRRRGQKLPSKKKEEKN